MIHSSPETTGGSRLLADPTDERSNCGVGISMNLAGGADHDVVADALEMLANLEHRGTTGAEENTGDGAGILLRHPHEFFAAETSADLGAPGEYAVGQFFLPTGPAERADARALIEAALDDEGLRAVEWREVPTDAADLGETALESEPAVEQCFVRPRDAPDADEFDRRLFRVRRTLDREAEVDRLYACSLDRRTVVYKGLLKATQLAAYYPDLADARVKSTFAMVHARFSTNTLGAWELAHPYRRTVHNGEINTIQGNRNWMRARELSHPALGDELDLVTGAEHSDTASVDETLDLLMAADRDLPHALRMLVPEAWHGDEEMADDRRAWYDFHASLVEPWDGPALVAATDGTRVAAVLDRNGLRPCRYDVTTDGRLYVASEAGALDVPADRIEERGRLKPGQLFLADPDAGRIVPDEEAFDDLTDDRYADWVAREQVRLADVRDDRATTPADPVADLRARQRVYGYTHDELENLLGPMAEAGKDPIGSMGDDTPLSVLSEFNRPLFSYFKQLFAQVSNPPLDYIREELVTSLETRLGRQRNLLAESSAHARQLVCDSPVLSDADLAAVRDGTHDVRAKTLDITYDPDGDLRAAVERVRAEASRAIDAGYEVLVLSDRRTAADRVPVPSLLATGAVHHHLVREGTRARVGLVVESGDPRTVHHLATLVGYGAGAVNPYLAYQTVADVGDEPAVAVAAYAEALEDGLLKTMAKMGISTVESYQGAQIFEAVGLDSDFVADYFAGTTARTGGIGVDDVEADLLERHASAFAGDDLERQGEFEFRSTGIHHQWNPQTVHTLQSAVREGDYEGYRTFAAMINDQSEELQTLRGLLEFEERESIPLEAVEPVEDIVTRFSTAAMSLGSLSPEAHENNAVATNRIGAKANTGEGGEPPERFDTERNCAIKQVASARFGVTSEYLSAAEDIQIKMAQGSKPGEGGQLPGTKVNEMIADVRFATPGVGLISPPPQHDIYSIEDLKQLIYDLRSVNEDARIHVKLVSEAGIGTIAAGVAKANADCVHISGHSGGTGASPRTSIKNAGLPWELGLAEANQLLRETGLRSRVTVRVDGGLKTGRDVAVGALLGAEEFAFGTASLVTSGCVMARQCHNNTCPVGIATQAGKLRERFPGEPDHVVNYLTFIARELREVMAELGFRTVEEMVGRVDVLRQRETEHPKARHLDLSAVVAEPRSRTADDRYKTRPQTHETDDHFDRGLLDRAEPALAGDAPVEIRARVDNEDRAVGAMLSGRVSAARGSAGLPTDAVTCRLTGSAGQSFGAFLAPGVSLHLEGTANDYVGKGLSGGKLSVRAPAEASYPADESVIVGNVALYGATDGEAYVNGVAGERFAVRNSGAKAVVEGVGDHGCEYMTGGVVAVLGGTGRNFAAGMSGGVAYVLDESGAFAGRCNTDMVAVERELDDRDEQVLRRLVENHADYTGSEKARRLLENWEFALARFVKVMPDAYRRAVEEDGREDVRDSPPASARVDASDAVLSGQAD